MANIIDRTGAEALIPQPLANELFQAVTQGSVVLSMGRRLTDMTAKQLRLPVQNSLPMAYFVNGDTGLKQTTKMDWVNKYITAEEIAVIVPVPENVLADTAFDIWASVQPAVIQGFGAKIDRAVFFGEDKPGTWPLGIVPAATAAGNVVTEGTGTSLYDDIMGKDGLISRVEKSGYMVTGYVASMDARGALRGTIDTTGQPIFRPGSGMATDTDYTLDGQRIEFPTNGSIVTTDPAMIIGGDWSQMVYSIRQDLTVKLLTEAVITNSAGEIIYNLPQQDMVALRFVMRLGWELPNPVNPIKPDGTKRYPFAALAPKP